MNMRFIALVLMCILSACNSHIGNNIAQTRQNRMEFDCRTLHVGLSKLAEQGHPEAQYHLGMMYNNGLGVDKDPTQAFTWFTSAAAANEPLAAFKLGCYYGGQFPDVVAVDLQKSFEYNLIAAEAGYALAQYKAGNFCYMQGKHEEALKWWKAAAGQGYPMALYNLSVTYKDGKIVAKDDILAYANFKLAKLAAEKHVNPQAQSALDEMGRTMSTADLAKAEQYVSEWQPQPTPLTRKALNGMEAAKELLKTPLD